MGVAAGLEGFGSAPRRGVPCAVPPYALSSLGLDFYPRRFCVLDSALRDPIELAAALRPSVTADRSDIAPYMFIYARLPGLPN